MVVAREPGGFSTAQASAAADYIAAADRSEGPNAVKAVPLTDAPGMLGAGGAATTIVAYLYLDPALSEDESQESAERFAAGLERATSAPVVKVTGALPATRSETEIAESHLIWVELATAFLVVAILALYFRSLGVPLLGLSTVAIAYLCADRVLGWIAERYGLSIPREAEPVIVALIFGVLTDYLVFFVSGYRQRLRQGERDDRGRERDDRRAAAGDPDRGADDRRRDADPAALRRQLPQCLRPEHGGRGDRLGPGRDDAGPGGAGDLRQSAAVAARRRRAVLR